jgi:hypothetical protein
MSLFRRLRIRMEPRPMAWYNSSLRLMRDPFPTAPTLEFPMAKPHRTLKKANHGSRPANSKARKAKRKHIRT